MLYHRVTAATIIVRLGQGGAGEGNKEESTIKSGEQASRGGGESRTGFALSREAGAPTSRRHSLIWVADHEPRESGTLEEGVHKPGT